MKEFQFVRSRPAGCRSRRMPFYIRSRDSQVFCGSSIGCATVSRTSLRTTSSSLNRSFDGNRSSRRDVHGGAAAAFQADHTGVGWCCSCRSYRRPYCGPYKRHRHLQRSCVTRGVVTTRCERARALRTRPHRPSVRSCGPAWPA